MKARLSRTSDVWKEDIPDAFIEVGTIDDIVAIAKEHGELIISVGWGYRNGKSNDPELEIEIYDDYRE